MDRTSLKILTAAICLSSLGLRAQIPDTIIVSPKISTTPVSFDADDPAIWIHPMNPEQSLIIGTDKGTYPNGGLFVWNLNGTQQQRIVISHPNNVDVRYGLPLSGTKVDIAVVTMRDHRQIRIFKIDATSRTLADISTLDSSNVINRMFKSSLGLALYQRSTDGAIFAIVSSADSDTIGELWQILLEDDGAGRVKGTLVRTFGDNTTEVEGIVADDELGYVYAAEQSAGIHKYYADPQQGSQRLAFFADGDGISGNREGLALYKCSDSTGYLLLSCPTDKAINVYRREGEAGSPHTQRLITTIRNTLDEFGDGLEVTNRLTTNDFSNGFLIWHNGVGRQFRLYAWEEVAQTFLKNCPESGQPTRVEGDSFGAAIRDFELRQNFPNPLAVHSQTEISFNLALASQVRLTVYNLLGQKVKTLENRFLDPGLHAITWNGKNDGGQAVASGIYLYELAAGSFSTIRKMTLLR